MKRNSDDLRQLLERNLLRVTGRSDQPGRPLLYGTTRRFLEVFGLGLARLGEAQVVEAKIRRKVRLSVAFCGVP